MRDNGRARGARGLLAAVLVLALGLGACDASPPANEEEGAYTVDEGHASVDTLFVLLGARLVGPEEEALLPWDGYHLAGSQVRTVSLKVDGEAWGVFEVAATAGSTGDGQAEGWSFRELADPALVVARLGLEVESSRSAPQSAGDWLDFLGRNLRSGGHVAEVEWVVLVDEEGRELQIDSGALVEFDVQRGDRSAVVGPLTLQLASLKGGE